MKSDPYWECPNCCYRMGNMEREIRVNKSRIDLRCAGCNIAWIADYIFKPNFYEDDS